jgi:uncharacterized protein
VILAQTSYVIVFVLCRVSVHTLRLSDIEGIGEEMSDMKTVDLTMDRRDTILNQIRGYVQEKCAGDVTGHDWHHVRRVAALARQLAIAEGADAFICEVAALVHDLVDDKLVSDVAAAMRETLMYLHELGIPNEATRTVANIITTISFKGGQQSPLETKEAMVVQDADRLDAIGAIGIARTFAYGGAKGQSIYNPDIPVRDSMTAFEYRTGPSTSINHFYEKLLKLKSLMNTETAKRVAEERHAFLVTYLDQFMREWNAEV